MRRTILYSITAARGRGHPDRLRTAPTTTRRRPRTTRPAPRSPWPRRPPPPTRDATDLATAETSLGTIVVDGNGMTAYYFLKDAKDSGHQRVLGRLRDRLARHHHGVRHPDRRRA